MFKIQNYPSPFLSSSTLFIPSVSSSVFLSLPSISHCLWAVRRALKATHYAAHTQIRTHIHVLSSTVPSGCIGIWLWAPAATVESEMKVIWISLPQRTVTTEFWMLTQHFKHQQHVCECLCPLDFQTHSKSHVKLSVLRLCFLKVQCGRFFLG